MPNLIRHIFEIIKVTALIFALATVLYLLLEHPGKPAATPPRASDMLGIPQTAIGPQSLDGHWTKVSAAEAQVLRLAGAPIVNLD